MVVVVVVEVVGVDVVDVDEVVVVDAELVVIDAGPTVVVVTETGGDVDGLASSGVAIGRVQAAATISTRQPGSHRRLLTWPVCSLRLRKRHRRWLSWIGLRAQRMRTTVVCQR